jgi:hypothetical protein
VQRVSLMLTWCEAVRCKVPVHDPGPLIIRFIRADRLGGEVGKLREGFNEEVEHLLGFVARHALIDGWSSWQSRSPAFFPLHQLWK